MTDEERQKLRPPRDLGVHPLGPGEFPVKGDRDSSFLGTSWTWVDTMTDEERQKLCAWLRTLSHPAVLQAADEVERLAKENTNLWVIIRSCQNDVLVAERERDEVLCRLKGTMQ